MAADGHELVGPAQPPGLPVLLQGRGLLLRPAHRGGLHEGLPLLHVISKRIHQVLVELCRGEGKKVRET